MPIDWSNVNPDLSLPYTPEEREAVMAVPLKVVAFALIKDATPTDIDLSDAVGSAMLKAAFETLPEDSTTRPAAIAAVNVVTELLLRMNRFVKAAQTDVR
jgi:hypothetical protein